MSGTARVAEHDMVPGLDGEPRDGTADLSASDESHSRHIQRPSRSRTLVICRIRCDPGCLPSAGGEVVAVVQVGEQAGLSGFPAEGPARNEAGRRVALRDYVREEPEVSRPHQFVPGNAPGGQAQTAADSLGDLAQRDALVPNRVPVSAGRALL